MTDSTKTAGNEWNCEWCTYTNKAETKKKCGSCYKKRGTAPPDESAKAAVLFNKDVMPDILQNVPVAAQHAFARGNKETYNMLVEQRKAQFRVSCQKMYTRLEECRKGAKRIVWEECDKFSIFLALLSQFKGCMTRLTHLNLDAAQLGTVECVKFCDAMRAGALPALKFLSMRGSTDMGRWTADTIQHTACDNKAICDDGMAAISQLVCDGGLQKLISLDLGYNNITDASMDRFADALNKLTQLKWLNLLKNHLTFEGIAKIKSKSLRGLQVSMQCVWPEPILRTARPFVDALLKNSLPELRILYTHFNHDTTLHGYMHLQEYCRLHKVSLNDISSRIKKDRWKDEFHTDAFSM